MSEGNPNVQNKDSWGSPGHEFDKDGFVRTPEEIGASVLNRVVSDATDYRQNNRYDENDTLANDLRTKQQSFNRDVDNMDALYMDNNYRSNEYIVQRDRKILAGDMYSLHDAEKRINQQTHDFLNLNPDALAGLSVNEFVGLLDEYTYFTGRVDSLQQYHKEYGYNWRQCKLALGDDDSKYRARNDFGRILRDLELKIDDEYDYADTSDEEVIKSISDALDRLDRELGPDARFDLSMRAQFEKLLEVCSQASDRVDSWRQQAQQKLEEFKLSIQDGTRFTSSGEPKSE